MKPLWLTGNLRGDKLTCPKKNRFFDSLNCPTEPESPIGTRKYGPLAYPNLIALVISVGHTFHIWLAGKCLEYDLQP